MHFPNNGATMMPFSLPSDRPVKGVQRRGCCSCRTKAPMRLPQGLTNSYWAILHCLKPTLARLSTPRLVAPTHTTVSRTNTQFRSTLWRKAEVRHCCDCEFFVQDEHIKHRLSPAPNILDVQGQPPKNSYRSFSDRFLQKAFQQESRRRPARERVCSVRRQRPHGWPQHRLD